MATPSSAEWPIQETTLELNRWLIPLLYCLPRLAPHGRALLAPVEALLALLDPELVPVDADLARRAFALYQRFGKGLDKGLDKGLGHTAQLNFGDCFAAALAEREQLPLAYAGEDFSAAGF